MAKIIFLDIDGVLNSGWEDEPFILPECSERLNRIIEETGAAVVLSSAWRKLIHSGEMTAKGFQCLLETHKVYCHVLGATPEKGGLLSRGKQITAWLAENGPVESYVVIDDDDLGIREQGHPFVQTNGGTGISEQDADLAIVLLNRPG
jgi:hypothetical protein